MTEYKALSLTQPWAQLIVLGEKRWETRVWYANYRGPLLIHAAKQGSPVSATEPYRSRLAAHGFDYVTRAPARGAVIGKCDLTGVVRTEYQAPQLTAQEIAFGDYTPGRWAFRLENIERLLAPIPWRGSLGIFDVSLPELGPTVRVP